MNHDERFACEPTHGICQRLCATQGYGAGSSLPVRTRTAYTHLRPLRDEQQDGVLVVGPGRRVPRERLW